jgi:hypothetical protein
MDKYYYAIFKTDCQDLFKVRKWNRFPKVMREMAGEQLIQQVDRPENIVDNEQYDGVIVIPANHQRIETQNKINNAFIPVIHGKWF